MISNSLLIIFYAKLFKTFQSLQTEAGRTEGTSTNQVMKKYLHDLSSEIS